MFTAGIGMVIVRGQLGLGVIVAALPFLGCPPRFGVQSFLGLTAGLAFVRALRECQAVAAGSGV